MYLRDSKNYFNYYVETLSSPEAKKSPEQKFEDLIEDFEIFRNLQRICWTENEITEDIQFEFVNLAKKIIELSFSKNKLPLTDIKITYKDGEFDSDFKVHACYKQLFELLFNFEFKEEMFRRTTNFLCIYSNEKCCKLIDPKKIRNYLYENNIILKTTFKEEEKTIEATNWFRIDCKNKDEKSILIYISYI